MVGVIPTITVIILNISGLKVPMKNQIVNVDKKIRPGSVLLQETHCKYKDTYNLKVNGLRKLFQAKTNQKKTGITILISDRVNIKAKKVIRDKEGHCIMIKGSFLQEDIIIITMYAPNNKASNYMRQTVM